MKRVPLPLSFARIDPRTFADLGPVNEPPLRVRPPPNAKDQDEQDIEETDDDDQQQAEDGGDDTEFAQLARGEEADEEDLPTFEPPDPNVNEEQYTDYATLCSLLECDPRTAQDQIIENHHAAAAEEEDRFVTARAHFDSLRGKKKVRLKDTPGFLSKGLKHDNATINKNQARTQKVLL